MRKLAIAFISAPLMAFAGLSMTSSTAHAGDGSADAASKLAPVDVLQVSGLFDPIVVGSIEQGITDAEEKGSQALILQINSSGSVVSDAVMTRLLQRVADAKIAIGVWVGPSSGARAYGAPAQLMAVADVTAMVAGSRVGYLGTPLTVNGQPVTFGANTALLLHGSMSFKQARTAGVLKLETPDLGVPTVRNMVLAMDGVTARGHVLDTVVPVLQADGKEQNTSTLVRFNGLGLADELMHTVASPPMAFLLFIIGLALLIFEFFTAGVGVAGFVGAVCAAAGCYGLAALPTRPVGVVLLLLAMVAFAIDVQVGIPRFWTGVGITLFILGAWFLYRPIDGNDMRLSWITLIVGTISIMLTYIVGMPSMVRTRFATPTIGREWMIGEMGTASTAISPEGVATIGANRWRARTNRATPIAAGAPLRVIAIDGATLEVEPQDGAARDHRERRPRD